MSKILEPSGYILYRVAEDNGFIDRYSIALNDLTRISGPARKIVMLAAECITGPDRSIHLHTGIPDQKDLKKSLGKLKSIVKFSANGAALNEEKIDTLKRLAGRLFIVTNTDLPESEVVSAYKEQWQIKRSFRSIKSFIEIRPVYHGKEERVKAHVFVCVPSLLLLRLIEKRLTVSHLSVKRMVEILRGIKAMPVKSFMRIVYGSESHEAVKTLNEMG